MPPSLARQALSGLWFMDTNVIIAESFYLEDYIDVAGR